ncbi:MAG: 3-hydroxyacyl-ACP dehydratase [Candidatus Methanoperedenaceae archaeon]|nr:MAG: 3-hydroxyacyl-ACP dehydratase [Candidatus Methanoperedenaceae archaeon]
MSGKHIDTTKSNEEFWKELGIDIEKHDELMKVLPEVFENVYLTQKNRPKSIAYFDKFIADIHGARPKEVVERKNNGDKVIGAFCAYFPEEIVHASGAVPLILCGGADFPVADAEKVLPRNTCPLIKSSFGFRTSRTCPYFLSADLLVGETTCGGKKKMYELLNEYTPTYTLHLPHKKDDVEARKLWLNEVKLFKNKVEELTGNKITKDRLNDSIIRVNRKREVLQELYDTRKVNPLPISGKDVLLVMQLAFFDEFDRFVEKTGELVKELKGRIKRGEGIAPKDTPRILISGTPMTIPNWKLHDIIEKSGAVVVAEESCTGMRYFSDLVDENSVSTNAQLKNLAERYLHINCACFTPNTERPEDVVRLAKEYNADGVVYYVLQFCHEFNIEFAKVERALKEEGIPVIKIETDYSQSDTGQLKTRLETFIEILRASKPKIHTGKHLTSVKHPASVEIA